MILSNPIPSMSYLSFYIFSLYLVCPVISCLTFRCKMLIRSCNCLSVIDIRESDYALNNKPATNMYKNALFYLGLRYKYTKF